MWVEQNGFVYNLANATEIYRNPDGGSLRVSFGGQLVILCGDVADRAWVALCEKSTRDTIRPEFQDEP